MGTELKEVIPDDVDIEDVIPDEYSELREPSDSPPWWYTELHEITMCDLIPDDPRDPDDYRGRAREILQEIDDTTRRQVITGRHPYHGAIPEDIKEDARDTLRTDNDTVEDYDPRGDTFPTNTMWWIVNAEEINDGRKRIIKWQIIPNCKYNGYSREETWEVVKWFCELSGRNRIARSQFDRRWEEEGYSINSKNVNTFIDDRGLHSLPRFDESEYERKLIKYQKKWEIRDVVED